MRWSITSDRCRGNGADIATDRTRSHVVWAWITAALSLVAIGVSSTGHHHHSGHDAGIQRLQFVADPRAGEAYVSVLNHMASVTWEWGSTHRALQAQVLVNTVQTDSRAVQELRLRAGGIDLVLIGKAGVFFCTAGCDVFHLPLAWSFNGDA
jgi:hypothetical protein